MCSGMLYSIVLIYTALFRVFFMMSAHLSDIIIIFEIYYSNISQYFNMTETFLLFLLLNYFHIIEGIK